MIACAWCSAAGPVSVLDWVLVAMAGAVVLYAFVSAVRYTLAPGELDANHVKRRILDQDDAGSGL